MLGLCACGRTGKQEHAARPDTPFMQDYSVKYNFNTANARLRRLRTNQKGKVQVLATDGLKHLGEGQFLYPGDVIEDNSYRFMSAKTIVDMELCSGEFIYLDKRAVFSNAWSGRLYVEHRLENPMAFAANQAKEFLVTDGKAVHFIRGGQVVWEGRIPGDTLVQLTAYPGDSSLFFLLAQDAIYQFTTGIPALKKILDGGDFTAFDVDAAQQQLIVGTSDGYFRYDLKAGKVTGGIQKKLPWTEITVVKAIAGHAWFGTSKGAFSVGPEGDIRYYASLRWLPSDRVADIAEGPDSSVVLLTDRGVGMIRYSATTLHDKAMFYERQVRDRHLRHGLNATLVGMQNGDLSTGYLADSDNDGLWTSLYLAAEAFRYATTGEQEALDRCRESLDAMARLYDINPVAGFPARSFERRGNGDTRQVLSDPERWQLAEHPEWYWKATTSSDEAIGHIFAFGVVAELVDHEEARDKAIQLIDTLLSHIVRNDLYLVDYDGQPTTWGRWNPAYVNAFPTNVGDRKLNSSNIISMLQTAYHFTGKSVYKETAFNLLEKHGYLENLMRPMGEIGKAPESADEWSQMLSGAWNHSDDEMYFAGYWGLYRYAFNDTLRAKYGEAIRDHWEAERPEKEAAWNIFTAIIGPDDFDHDAALWYLREYPLDLIQWTVHNSHRRDINLLAPNFRNQTTEDVLPPDELKISRHNANRFVLDGGSNGAAESSAGDIWLFPYWMGRYLGVIGAPDRGE